MSARGRMIMIWVGVLGPAVVFAEGFLGLPAFGNYPGPYGDMINSLAPWQRHVTNAVAAVNFDYRALDTLGEEFILFAAVSGLVLLLRGARGERQNAPAEPAENRQLLPRSTAIHWFGYGMIGLLNLFGLYVVLHGHLTPGGGFQGGVILATASLLVYLATNYETYRTAAPKQWIEFCEAAGAGLYAIVGLSAIVAGGAFLANFLPLGKLGDLFSGGTILVLNCAVGMAVAAGFSLLFLEYLEETRAPADEDEEEEK